MCRYVLTCASMYQHVKPLLAPLIPTIWNLSCMLACVSKFGLADMCWYVPACADMCRQVPTCDINVLTCANMWNHSQRLWYQPFEPYLACCHVSAHLDMPTCAYMCRHVLTCANMCRHLTLISTPLMAVIKTLSGCWHVSVSVDMSACTDMCRHVPACANIWNHCQHLWYQPFEPYLACWHVSAHWTCRHVLIYTTCANMWH